MSNTGVGPAHIAFMSIPAHGHVNPGLGLVAELVKRGHRVTYATTEDFVPQVSEAGAVPVVYESILPSASTNEQWPEDMVTVASLFLDETNAVLPQVEAAYDSDRPDLFVYDTAAAQAVVLGEKWGIPYVALSPSHVPFEGFEALGWDKDPAMEAFFARYNEFLDSQDVGLTLDELQRPSRCVVTLPRSFQYKADTVPDTNTFVGPMLTERAHQGDWKAPDERPVLLISLGSAFNDQLSFYRTCVEAFADLDWHVVLSVGRFVDPADLGTVPLNFEVHQWIPQLRMLSQASAFITHAGMGGTVEALTYGVPMIGVPQAGDQFANAARIEELRLGRHLVREEATADSLREALRYITSHDDIRSSVLSMRKEIEQLGGAPAAAKVIEAEL